MAGAIAVRQLIKSALPGAAHLLSRCVCKGHGLPTCLLGLQAGVRVHHFLGSLCPIKFRKMGVKGSTPARYGMYKSWGAPRQPILPSPKWGTISSSTTLARGVDYPDVSLAIQVSNAAQTVVSMDARVHVCIPYEGSREETLFGLIKQVSG